MVALAITVTTALAATSRAEYVAQANPICAAADRPVGKAIHAYFKALQRKGLLSQSSEVTEKTIGPTVRFARGTG
ncbi:MAG TPA: hypothetical protein VHU24_07440 [Solirubrobacterales bacterium]|nr:hypothetical protein [Solirubrobacterales bacterium]